MYKLFTAVVLLGCSSGVLAQADKDQLRYAEMALTDEAELLGGQLACYSMLYRLPADQMDQNRLEDFGHSWAALMEDYSNRIEAHVTKFTNPTIPYRRKAALRFSTWRMVAAKFERQQTLPTDGFGCRIVASGALARAEEKGLRRSTTLTRER